MEYQKFLFGKTVVDSTVSDELSSDEKFELEYYETKHSSEESKRKFGIEVVKKKNEDAKFNIESKIVNNLSNEEKTIKKLLNMLLMYKVTPTTVDDIISDIKAM